MILATATPYDGLVTSLTNAAQTAADGAMSGITAVLPIGLTVMGAVVVVSIGIKVFKTVVKK